MTFSRREFLASAAVLGGALAAGSLPAAARGAQPAAGSPAPPMRRRVLRVAHLSDLHIQPERSAAKGLAACLAHLAALPEKADHIIGGGDMIMDAFGADEARSRTQWELLTKTLKDHCGVEIRHTLGNHDIWGSDKTKSKTKGDEPRWGKAWALEQFGLARPYYSYDKGSWHFVHLDSIRPKDASYTASLDPEQLDWLKADLAGVAADRHVLVVSHVPILSLCALFDRREQDPVRVNPATMHADAAVLHRMFVKNGRVRACLSGHIHQTDRQEYQGVQYFCNGAVCGNWWKDGGDRALPGYALVDLYSDGSCENRYVEYGWTMDRA